MSASCKMKEESAEGKGVRRGDSKGKNQGNHPKGMWWQVTLKDRGQMTKDLTAKLLRVGGFIRKAMRAHERVGNKRKMWLDLQVWKLGSLALIKFRPPPSPKGSLQKVTTPLSQHKAHGIYTTRVWAQGSARCAGQVTLSLWTTAASSAM